MKKILCLMLAFVSALAFAKPDKNEKILIDQGIELCLKMKEKADCTSYLEILTGSEELLSAIKNLCKGDFTKLESVIRVRIDEKLFCDEFFNESLSDSEKNMSENLKKDLKDKIFSSIAMRWTGQFGGAEILAASSILSSSSAFDVNFSFDKCIYVFKYKDSFPVCVVYLHGKDKAVTATATVVADENFPDSMSPFITTENIE